MLDGKLTTTQRRKEVELNLRDEIILLASKSLMRPLFYYNDNISWQDAWCLITLPSESDRLSSLHTLVDMHLKHLFLRYHLLAVTLLALVLLVDDFTRTMALVASLLDLLDHGTHLTHDDTDTAAITFVALLHRTLLATLAVTFATDNVARKCKLRYLALVEIFEGDSDAVNEILGFARAGSCLAATAEGSAATE